MKRLYRSNTNRLFLGVCAGFANYFKIRPIIIRLILILAGFRFPLRTLIFYIILALLIPAEPKTDLVRHIFTQFYRGSQQNTERTSRPHGNSIKEAEHVDVEGDDDD